MTSERKLAEVNFSFAGCGFLGMYHFGVAACLKHYVPQYLNKVSGSSAGALASTFIVADISLSDGAGMWISTCVETRNKVIGALSPSSDVAGHVRQHLESCLPSDAHLLVNDKVFISMTRVRDMKNFVFSKFESRAEFIDALICSVTIPFFVGLVPPRFRGERYIDGGFSNGGNQIIQNEQTVTVSPFCGESDICPRDGPTLSPWVVTTFNKTSIEISTQNLKRLSHTIMPPGPETLANICHQGYTDALQYLRSRGLVKCQPCLVPGTCTDADEIAAGANGFIANIDDDEELIWICQKCEAIREFSEEKGSRLPEPFLDLFHQAILADSTSLRALLRQYKIIRFASLMTLPVALSYDAIYAAAVKLTNIPRSFLPKLPTSKRNITTFQESLEAFCLKLPQWE